MLSSSLLLLAAALVAVGTFILLVVLISYLNFRHEVQKTKSQLRKKVMQLRLYKMLEFLGVNFDDYISKLSDEEILNHIENCSACPDNPACDRCLRDRQFVSNLDFCPNYTSLIECSKTLAA